ncbi:DUF1853 family protein [Psychrobacter sp. FDAARGOS_221]|uniref:DUF1853 family protein n=1 Tax=Psychrobacter sp. FDAARGOS_221 TaxID=1975705 RepID=UPI000BB59444|nr:DUF1853 family protein [Psychrobacter sp. FDAARGOS_221]PNK61263.1 DUF1853 domain-containing protein [Psychrobacter sp. FDAARGOS_221]
MNTDNDTPWEAYRRPFVRDLAFALACPDALKRWQSPEPNLASPPIFVHEPSFWQSQFQRYAQRLQQLDNTNAYQDLTRYLMSRPSPYRLGFHFEGLIHFWLEDGYRLGLHPYEVVAHNVQLYNGMQTTGELDFILRNHDTDQIEHWELAIKFYLGSAPYDYVNWVGINSRDNLERKLIHMQSKPFRSVWVDLDGYHKIKIDKRYVVLKGRFFQPAHQSSDQATDRAFVRPEWLNDSFPMHRWHRLHNRSDWEALHQDTLDKEALRPAHYIEWFTQRHFYDASFLASRPLPLDPSLDKDELRRRRYRLAHWPYQPLEFEDIDTNLYMKHAEPVVLVVD